MFALACVVVLVPGFAYLFLMDGKAVVPKVKSKTKSTDFIIVFW